MEMGVLAKSVAAFTAGGYSGRTVLVVPPASVGDLPIDRFLPRQKTVRTRGDRRLGCGSRAVHGVSVPAERRRL